MYTDEQTKNTSRAKVPPKKRSYFPLLGNSRGGLDEDLQ